MKIGSFQGMKSLNKSIVLNKIRTDGPISRAMIARITKLTPPTVSKMVSELIESELVVESDLGESLGGRKPTMLVINNKKFHVIGLDVGPKYIRVIMTDLSGTVVAKDECLIPFPIAKNSLLTLAKNIITAIMVKNPEKVVIGIGVGMHGAVDVERGIGLYAPLLHLTEIPLKADLEKEFDVLLKVDNDVRALAFGEYWFCEESRDKNMVTVNIGHGVGAGIVLNGQLFHGEHDLAGEIGHMTIDLAGRPCSCGNNGCWQTLVAGPAIAEAAVREITLGKDSIIRDLANGELGEIEGETVYEAALQGDPLAIDILHKSGEYIGIGLTNLIHMVNPAKIIIAGGVANAGEFMLDNIKETIARRGLTDKAKATEIVYSSRGKFGTAIGAASLVLADVFLDISED